VLYPDHEAHPRDCNACPKRTFIASITRRTDWLARPLFPGARFPTHVHRLEEVTTSATNDR